MCAFFSARVVLIESLPFASHSSLKRTGSAARGTSTWTWTCEGPTPVLKNACGEISGPNGLSVVGRELMVRITGLFPGATKSTLVGAGRFSYNCTSRDPKQLRTDGQAQTCQQLVAFCASTRVNQNDAVMNPARVALLHVCCWRASRFSAAQELRLGKRV